MTVGNSLHWARLSQAWVTGMTLPSPLTPDEKNGIPNSPQKVALTLDLDTEKEPEEPQQPRKPSVFIVFQKVWLGCSPSHHSWERQSHPFQPSSETLRMEWDLRTHLSTPR